MDGLEADGSLRAGSNLRMQPAKADPKGVAPNPYPNRIGRRCSPTALTDAVYYAPAALRPALLDSPLRKDYSSHSR